MSKDKEIKRIKELMFGKEKETEHEENDIDGEMTEEGEATTGASGGGPSQGYPTVTKWESGVTRGKANPIANNKWESGITRGKANTLI